MLVCSRAGFAVADDTVLSQRIEAVRARIGGRLGLHVFDTQTGRRIGFDDASRYAMASTFKLLLAAAILQRADRGAIDLDAQVPLRSGDMISHAPVTSKHLEKGLISVRELCAAVVEVSDNPAANLLLNSIDGPAGFTQFVRSLGDTVTRLDRYELELNTNLPGDPRDTTTPRAMVNSMERVLTGQVLSAASRELLIGWLVNSPTGLKRLRAGLPATWRVGDKTGSGANGAINNVAIAWPPARKPILLALYLSASSQPTDALNAAHAEIAKLIVDELLQ